MLTLVILTLIFTVIWLLWGPIPSPARIIVTVILALAVILWLAQVLGAWPGLSSGKL